MPYQSKIILTVMGMIAMTSIIVIVLRYIAPGWQMASHFVAAAISGVNSTNAENAASGGISVPAGASTAVEGTDVTLTNTSVAVQDLSQPFDALYIVTIQATRGGRSAILNLTLAQPAGYSDQPTVVWNGYRFTLVTANPLGVQSATIQVQAQA